MVFTHGNIYTLAGEPAADVEGEPKATAIAIRAGRIVAIGTDAAVERYRGSKTQAHDLAGATVFPGWVDAHVHLQGLGRRVRDVDLVDTTSYEEVIERVRARAATQPPGTWVRGRGWDQNDWPVKEFPDHEALSQAVPEHPVYLRRIDGHALLVNAAALAIAGVDARVADPPGGRIERRADGTPSGVLVDGAMQLVTRVLPVPDAAERRSSLRAALAHCAQGLTGVHDAGASVAEIDDDVLAGRRRAAAAHHAMDRRSGRLGGHARALAAGPGNSINGASGGALRQIDGRRRARIARRGAARTLLRRAARARPAAVHAGRVLRLGAAAARRRLPNCDALHRRRREPYGARCLRTAAARAAAARHPAPDRARADPLVGRHPALRGAAILPSMQPTHCTLDMPWQRVGIRAAARRLRLAFVARHRCRIQWIRRAGGIGVAVARDHAAVTPGRARRTRRRLAAGYD
jgi:hypothetical protein